jgi:preprotein translocase subunit YajC
VKGTPVWEYAILFIVVMGVMLLTSILPQRRRDRETKQTLDRVRRGVRVITTGGIHGLVTDVKDDVVSLRVADKVEIKVAKSAIGQVVRSGAAEPEPEKAEGGSKKGRRQG